MTIEEDAILLALGNLDLSATDAENFEVVEHLGELDGAVVENHNVREISEVWKAYELKKNRSQLIRYLEFALAIAKEMDDPIVISLIQNALARLRE